MPSFLFRCWPVYGRGVWRGRGVGVGGPYLRDKSGRCIFELPSFHVLFDLQFNCPPTGGNYLQLSLARRRRQALERGLVSWCQFVLIWRSGAGGSRFVVSHPSLERSEGWAPSWSARECGPSAHRLGVYWLVILT